MTSPTSDIWNAGKTYEDFMGRWSRPLALEFLKWVKPRPGWHWLDVGTGTGALAAAITHMAQPASLVACDPSAQFIESAKGHLADPRVTFAVAGTGNLPPRGGGYDAIVSGLALNFFPDPRAAIEEQLALLRRSGLVAAFVWDYAEGMEFLRHFWDAATALAPEAEPMDEGRRFPICNPEALESLFVDAGVAKVQVTSIGVPTEFDGFDDYWSPFLGGTGPAPSFVATLSDEQRRNLVDDLQRRLPIHDGGGIKLWAKAWAVAGRAR